jgi:hypothetical protein
MLIGAMTNFHDNVPMIEAAVQLFNRSRMQPVLHAGDFVAPFAIDPLRQLGWPVRRLFTLLVLLGWLALSASPQVNAQVGSDRFRRGIVVSCPRAGEIWGSPEMATTLTEITSLGAEWVAIHPYAHVRRDGIIRFRPAAETGYLERAAKLASQAGVDLFWKPHLAYWGSFAWRGDIEFGNDTGAWQRFFAGYEQFIVDQARFAESVGVDLFSVGVEYERTTGYEDEWRKIIAAVRSVYRGRITYAANWDSLERVPFWDALDLIGVHAYFPLGEGPSPDRSVLWQGWDEPLAMLEALSRRYQGKQVLFAEIGYPRSPTAATRPWVPENRDQPEVRALRQTLIEVALERIEASPFIDGMFWWKWIPGDDRWDRDFSMKDHEARQALSGHWGRKSTAPTAR